MERNEANSPSVMYKLRPIFKLEEAPISTCVYKMARICARFGSISPPSQSEEQPGARSDADDGLAELERRWTAINSRLQQLQTEIANFKNGPRSVTAQVMMPSASTIQQLTTKQEIIVQRISELMSSLSQLKSRLASLEDPQNTFSTGGLQEQQKTLLERIKELNDEIRMISSTLNNNNDHSSLQIHSCCPDRRGTINAVPREFQDVVIRAHPSRPPLSLILLLNQLRKTGVSIYSSTHVHSNAANYEHIDRLKSFLPVDTSLERSDAHMALTLIWSQGPTVEPSLMLSPSCQAVPIEGEANIARYLSRLIPGLLYETGDVNRAARLDRFLDLTDPGSPLGSNGSKRDRPAALQAIEKSLDSSPSLDGGPNIGMVDAVLYSAITNAQVDLKDMGKSTSIWIQRCQSVVQVSPTKSGKINQERRRLEAFLDQLDIKYRTLEHPAVLTVSAMMEHVTSLPGFYVKNLFVKDKKSSKLYLISARHDANVSLSQVSKVVGAKELRFASEDLLVEALAVGQGSVTPLALLNDADKHRVTFVIDEQLVRHDEDRLNVHPLTNEATTNLTVAHFKRFLEATGHQPILLHL